MLLSFAFESGSCHVSECVFNIDAVERTRLVKHHIIVFFGPLLALCSRNLAFVLLVQLVAETNERESLGVIRACIVEEPTLPSVEITKRVCVCHIISKCTAVCSSVKGIPKGLKLFLTCGIPDLKCNNGVIN